jgi:hypothetical protein
VSFQSLHQLFFTHNTDSARPSIPETYDKRALKTITVAYDSEALKANANCYHVHLCIYESDGNEVHD